jgi:hypothetical protein
MTASGFDLNGALEALGWSGVELARRIDVGADRVSAWRCGKAKVPGAVVPYLRLAMSVRDLLR